MKTKIISCVALLALVLVSCKKKDEEQNAQLNLSGGVMIMCEGNYGDGNASVSYYTRGSVVNDLFQIVNGRPLGDQGQSITIIGGKAYLIIQNSGKIEVVDTATFRSVATIDDRIESPRYMVAYDEQTAFVTDWYSDYVKVVDLATNRVTDSIEVDQRPEQLLISNGKLFVSNTGIWPARGTKITVINPVTLAKITSIDTPDNPGGMVVDANGDLWVMCGGDSYANVDGNLVKISTSNYQTLTTIALSSPGDYPYHLRSNGDKDDLFYTISGKIYTLPITATAEASTPMINRSFYSFEVDPAQDDIYGLEAPSFITAGKVVRFNSAGVKQDSATVGVAPGSAAF